MKIPTMHVAGVTSPAAKVDRQWGSLVSQEDRRTTGVTPRSIGLFPSNPARLLSRSRAFKSLAGMTKRKGKPGVV
jgi:hypothetical protein